MQDIITFVLNHNSLGWQALFTYSALSFMTLLYFMVVFAWEDIDMRFFSTWKLSNSKFGYNCTSSLSWLMLFAMLPFVNIFTMILLFVLPPAANWFVGSEIGHKFEAWWTRHHPPKTADEIVISRTNPFPGVDKATEEIVKKMIDNCVVLFPDNHRFIIGDDQILSIEAPDSQVISSRPLVGLEKYLLSQIVVLQTKLMRAEAKNKGK